MDKTSIDGMRWARNPKGEEPITTLDEHQHAADGWREDLAEQKPAPPPPAG